MTFSKISKTVAALSVAATLALAPSASAGAGGKGQLSNWAEGASIAVDSVMKYPSIGVRGNGSGLATFRVTIDRDGDVISSKQTQRIKGAALNSAAKRVVKNADFPALPSSLDRDTLTFELQLSYLVGGPETEALRPGSVTSRRIASNRGPLTASVRVLPANAD